MHTHSIPTTITDNNTMLKFSDFYKHTQSSFSPNGSYVASVVDQKRLVIRNNTASLTIMHVFECPYIIHQFQWSPNSKHILVANTDKSVVQVWSLMDIYWHGRIRDESFGFRRVWWSADSTSILCSSEFKVNKYIYIYNY